jgi:hypothetical protein
MAFLFEFAALFFAACLVIVGACWAGSLLWYFLRFVQADLRGERHE